jgi:hypothetical protein
MKPGNRRRPRRTVLILAVHDLRSCYWEMREARVFLLRRPFSSKGLFCVIELKTGWIQTERGVGNAD